MHNILEAYKKNVIFMNIPLLICLRRVENSDYFVAQIEIDFFEININSLI